jgi:hypothetical protein
MYDKLTVEQAIAESRRIEEAATEGPWSIKSAATAGQYDITAETVGDMVRLVACSMDKDGKGAITHAADARFIAHARNTHRLLLDVAEAANTLLSTRLIRETLADPVCGNTPGSTWRTFRETQAALQAFAAYMSGETK